MSVVRAVAAGLTHRRLIDTVGDTLARCRTWPPERCDGTIEAGIAPEREAEVLAAWKASQPAP